mmetsp:Transcript_30318/g.65396  ORF Transcript_30318/g.65396 Transcript_30318/m.65396 type:complete len:122 (+) Transcript_30318:273-638(+)
MIAVRLDKNCAVTLAAQKVRNVFPDNAQATQPRHLLEVAAKLPGIGWRSFQDRNFGLISSTFSSFVASSALAMHAALFGWHHVNERCKVQGDPGCWKTLEASQILGETEMKFSLIRNTFSL